MRKEMWIKCWCSHSRAVHRELDNNSCLMDDCPCEAYSIELSESFSAREVVLMSHALNLVLFKQLKTIEGYGPEQLKFEGSEVAQLEIKLNAILEKCGLDYTWEEVTKGASC